MSASLGKLLVIFVRNQGQMHVNRYLPAKGIIQTYILRGRGKVFVASYHMGNVHSVVIHYVCKIVGGIAVGFNQNHVIQLAVVDRNVSVQLVMECGGSFRGVVLPDDERLTLLQILFDFFFG